MTLTVVLAAITSLLSTLVISTLPLLLILLLLLFLVVLVTEPNIRKRFFANFSNNELHGLRLYLLLLVLQDVLVILLWYINHVIGSFPHTLSPFLLIILVITIIYGWRISVITLCYIIPVFVVYILGIDYTPIWPIEFLTLYTIIGFSVAAVTGLFLRRYQEFLGTRVTESQELLWKIRRRLAEKTQEEQTLKAVNHAALALVSTSNLKNILRIILQESRKLVEVPYAGIATRQNDEQFSCDVLLGRFGNAKHKRQFVKKIETLLSGLLTHRGHSQLIEVSQKQLDTYNFSAFLIQTMLIVPIMTKETFSALFVMRSFKDEQFSQRDREKIKLFAAHADLAIRQTQHNDELTKLMQARDQFASAISHELKTPLTTIKLYAQMLQEKIAGKAGALNARSGLTIIDQESDKLSMLINTIHDFARIQSGQFSLEYKPFSLIKLCQERIEVFSLLHKEHRFVFETELSRATTIGDQLRTEEVLSNLLKNAAKYSLAGTTITLKLWKDKDYYYFSVTDQGSGISLADARKIFEPFFRLSEQNDNGSQGLGLGLYIAKNIVEMQGGRIWVESKLDKGSTFTVALPITQSSKA